LESGLTEVPLIVDNASNSSETVIKSVIDNVLWQMDSDRKTTALKQFQGNVWRFAYESGAIRGQYVFPLDFKLFENYLDFFLTQK